MAVSEKGRLESVHSVRDGDQKMEKMLTRTPEAMAFVALRSPTVWLMFHSHPL